MITNTELHRPEQHTTTVANKNGVQNNRFMSKTTRPSATVNTHPRKSTTCDNNQTQLAATLWWFTAAPKPLKTEFLGGSPSPQGSHSPYILRDTTRPGHVTCVLVWSKSDRRWLRKTLHKQTNRQTNKQTDRQTDTTKITVTWPWTNDCTRQKRGSNTIQRQKLLDNDVIHGLSLVGGVRRQR